MFSIGRPCGARIKAIGSDRVSAINDRLADLVAPRINLRRCDIVRCLSILTHYIEFVPSLASRLEENPLPFWIPDWKMIRRAARVAWTNWAARKLGRFTAGTWNNPHAAPANKSKLLPV